MQVPRFLTSRLKNAPAFLEEDNKFTLHLAVTDFSCACSAVYSIPAWTQTFPSVLTGSLWGFEGALDSTHSHQKDRPRASWRSNCHIARIKLNQWNIGSQWQEKPSWGHPLALWQHTTCLKTTYTANCQQVSVYSQILQMPPEDRPIPDQLQQSNPLVRTSVQKRTALW